MTQIKKTIIYTRVSTEDQEKEGTSLQTQMAACLDYCQKNGYEVTSQFSEAYSGLTLDRPKLNELRDLIRAGDIKVVIIYCLDRLSRDPTHGVILTQEFEKYGVKLEAVTEDVNTSDLGKLISYIRGLASKVEAEKIKERTTRGKRAFLNQGKIPAGCGKGIYGYSWDKKNKKRIPLEFEAKVVQRIFDDIVSGKGYFNVARSLNDNNIPSKSGGKWSANTVSHIAGNPAYVGLTYYGQHRGSRKTKLIKQPKSDWILLPAATPAIVGKEQFDRVQEIRQQNRELQRVRTTHDYLLRGHAICGCCGAPLVGSFMNKFRYYHCRASYPTANRVKSCAARYIRADYLEEVVWENMRKTLEQPDLVMAGIKEQLNTEHNNNVQGVCLDKEIEKLRKQVKKYDSEEKRLIQLFRYSQLSHNAILDEINHLKAERAADTLRLENLSKTKERIESLENAEIKLADCCQQLKSQLDSATYQDKRYILDMLAIKATATPDAVNIDGVIPLETAPSKTALASVETKHGRTDIPMSVQW